jgi:hypothetical protein
VRGKKIAQADAPQADAIPWLLLQATAHEGDGVFSKVEYIQRISIQGHAICVRWNPPWTADGDHHRLQGPRGMYEDGFNETGR